MGVTKILSIKGQLDSRLAYVTNSEKTHLATDITYITNPEKTEQSFFVSAINCLTAESAFDEMMNTKIRFRKNRWSAGLSYHPVFRSRRGNTGAGPQHWAGVLQAASGRPL